MMEIEPQAPQDESEPLPPWKTSPGWWIRRVAAPLVVIVVIAGAIVWLQAPDSPSDRRTARADEPLESDSAAPQEGSAAPPIRLTTLEGEDVSLSDYLGKLVVLNFWATWCGPCREEMPLFEQAQQHYGSDNIVVLAVNVREGSGTVRPFVERFALTYPILLDERGSVARRYRVRSFPTTYFIGRDGTVEGRRVGAYTHRVLFGRIDQLLDVP
jgi:cytochrome c biogenesis protein CcmG/thiol:disulfide interchange protein DsbE